MPNEINLALTPNNTQNIEKTKLTIAQNQPMRRFSTSKNVSLICTQCGKLFENRCKLTRHLIDHKMAQSPYRCPFSNCLQCYDSRIKFLFIKKKN